MLSPSRILLTEVTFKVKCNTRGFGEDVYIVGDCTQLGNWNADHALILSTSKQVKPIWSITVSLPSEIVVQYKYILKVGKTIKRWENFPGNRRLRPSGFSMVLDDGIFGQMEVQASQEEELTGGRRSFELQGSRSVPTSCYNVNKDDSDRKRILIDYGWLIHEMQLRVFIGHQNKESFTGIELFQSSLEEYTGSPMWPRKKNELSVQNPEENSFFESTERFQSSPHDTHDSSSSTEISSSISDSISVGSVKSGNGCERHLLNAGVIDSPSDCFPSFTVSVNAVEPQNLETSEIWQSFQYRPADECFVLIVTKKENLSFFIDLLVPYGEEEELLGRVYIDYYEMSDLRGRLVRPILNRSLKPIGRITLQYLIITPLVHPNNNISSTFFHKYWNEPLFIGHRGSGATDAAEKNYDLKLATENTLLSFIAAARLGADYIEFDVQLTKDQVPIIAHDEEICVNTTAVDGTNIVLKVPLNKLNLNKLRNLKPVMHCEEKAILSQNNAIVQHSSSSLSFSLSSVEELSLSRGNSSSDLSRRGKVLKRSSSFSSGQSSPIPTPNRKDSSKLAKLKQDTIIRFSSHSISSSDNSSSSIILDRTEITAGNIQEKIRSFPNMDESSSPSFLLLPKVSVPCSIKPPVSDPSRLSAYWRNLETYPTLEQVFRFVPNEVGFNIEIKYPDDDDREKYLAMMERNQYVDRILSVILDNAKGRNIIISSFDPDICVVCALKQLCYPVFFLTTAGRDGPPQKDPRKNSVEEAIHFASANHLDGIVSYCEPILENLSIVKKVHKLKLLIFTYGTKNSDPNCVLIQKEAGVDAVICDKVFKIKRESRNGMPISKSRNPYLGNFWIHNK